MASPEIIARKYLIDFCQKWTISDIVRQRVFEPFFTTKPADQGTGLGLAILQQIVTNHNGSVRVDSEFGQGTTFYIMFPIKR